MPYALCVLPSYFFDMVTQKTIASLPREKAFCQE